MEMERSTSKGVPYAEFLEGRGAIVTAVAASTLCRRETLECCCDYLSSINVNFLRWQAVATSYIREVCSSCLDAVRH